MKPKQFKIAGFTFNGERALGISFDKFYEIYKTSAYNGGKEFSGMTPEEVANQKEKLTAAYNIINPSKTAISEKAVKPEQNK